MTKRPEAIYHYRGPIERGIGGSYVWHDGYSQNSPEGGVYYPWNTRAECRRSAKLEGKKAVFYRDGKPEVF